MKVVAYCETCRHKHHIDYDPSNPDDQFRDWVVKHCGHWGVGFNWPERSTKKSWVDRMMGLWRFGGTLRHITARPVLLLPESLRRLALVDAVAAFLPNSDVKEAFAASSTLTASIASLATSSTKLAGWESAAFDNTTNKYLDALLAGLITVGTTPTTNTGIDVCLVGMRDDSTWPDVFDGTDSAETVTNQEIKDQICKPFQTISVVSTSSNIGYWYGPGGVASRFGGVLPRQFDLFIAHNTGVNLNATAGNHVQSVTPTYLTVLG